MLFPIAAAGAAVGVVTAAGVGLAAPGQRTAPVTAAQADAARAGAVPARAGAPPAADADARADEMKVPSRPVTISAGRSPAGPVLVGDGGRTLYVFSADKLGASSCTGACARSWLPVISHGGKPQGSAQVPAALVGSILRADGSYQVTLERRPLYYYAGDRRPGDANGRGRTAFGGTWQVAAMEDKP